MSKNLAAQELELLKQRADDMGIKYSPNIGLDALRAKVNGELLVPTDTSGLAHKVKEMRKLHRVIITCLNPNKKDMEGEFFRVGNAKLNIARFIPYEIETHIEDIMLNALRDRKYTHPKMTKKADGTSIPDKVLRNEFQIQVLPQLTQEELKKLAKDQLARGTNQKD